MPTKYGCALIRYQTCEDRVSFARSLNTAIPSTTRKKAIHSAHSQVKALTGIWLTVPLDQEA